MQLINASSAASLTGNWIPCAAGTYQPIVTVASAGTITFQFAISATTGTTTGTSLGNLKDTAGTDISLTATTGPRASYVVTVPKGWLRASSTGVSGGAVSAWLQPIAIETGNTGLE